MEDNFDFGHILQFEQYKKVQLGLIKLHSALE